jgi:hypothetical protein
VGTTRDDARGRVGERGRETRFRRGRGRMWFVCVCVASRHEWVCVLLYNVCTHGERRARAGSLETRRRARRDATIDRSIVRPMRVVSCRLVSCRVVSSRVVSCRLSHADAFL